MRRKWRKAKPKEVGKKIVSNRGITALEVFLIDETGEQLGKIETVKALQMAKDADLDLVLVNPKGDVPVAKIINLGQLKYENEKKLHKQKAQQKKIDTKEIRLSVRISIHDFDFRINQAIKFLEKDQKLKIDLVLKGRERQHPEKAKETINRFIETLEKNKDLNVIAEQPLTKQGGRFSIILMNKK